MDTSKGAPRQKQGHTSQGAPRQKATQGHTSQGSPRQKATKGHTSSLLVSATSTAVCISGCLHNKTTRHAARSSQTPAAKSMMAYLLLATLSHVNHCLSLALGLQDAGALAALSLCLQLHGNHNACRQKMQDDKIRRVSEFSRAINCVE
jgi:hypothetical protein